MEQKKIAEPIKMRYLPRKTIRSMPQDVRSDREHQSTLLKDRQATVHKQKKSAIFGVALDELRREFSSEYSTFSLLLSLEFLLIACGAVVLYSNSNMYMLQRHMIWLGLGSLIAMVLYFIPVSIVVNWVPYLAFLALILNVLPQFPSLQLANDGSPRWVSFAGYSFQFSETLRLMMVLYFARHISLQVHKTKRTLLAKNMEKPSFSADRCSKILYLPLLYLQIGCVLVILQKDYSTTVLLLLIAAAIAILVGSWKTLLFSIIIFIAMTAVAMLFLGQTFRVNRIMEWFADSGEQINWVYDAFRQGGWFGQGLGQGWAKHLVPAEMTDFPLAAVGEEMGLIGIILVLLLFVAFAITGFELARKSNVLFVRYATAGLVGLVILQAMVNFAVSSGLLPVTGQPLPFFSVGGSSTLTYMVIFGLINSLNRPAHQVAVIQPNSVAQRLQVANIQNRRQRGSHLDLRNSVNLSKETSSK